MDKASGKLLVEQRMDVCPCVLLSVWSTMSQLCLKVHGSQICHNRKKISKLESHSFLGTATGLNGTAKTSGRLHHHREQGQVDSAQQRSLRCLPVSIHEQQGPAYAQLSSSSLVQNLNYSIKKLKSAGYLHSRRKRTASTCKRTVTSVTVKTLD